MNDNTNKSNRFTDFHAGRFLREELDRSGHDSEWLSAQTGVPIEELEKLYTEPNMDALLFVRLGNPLRPHFFDRLHERIFGPHPDDVA